MKLVFPVLLLALTLSGTSYAQPIGVGSGVGVQDEQATSSTTTSSTSQKATTSVKTDESKAAMALYVKTLQNVQIELTLTDQQGNQAPEKKTVSMIVSSGDWGKIRSAASVMPPGEPPYGVELNVDARPFVSVDGPIRLEMTMVYAPSRAADSKEGPKARPTGINQSQTVVLQSGKPLVISQAADPVSDRKVIVEVKATVLK